MLGPALPWALDKVEFFSMFQNVRQDFQGALIKPFNVLFHESSKPVVITLEGSTTNPRYLNDYFTFGTIDMEGPV